MSLFVPPRLARPARKRSPHADDAAYGLPCSLPKRSFLFLLGGRCGGRVRVGRLRSLVALAARQNHHGYQNRQCRNQRNQSSSEICHCSSPSQLSCLGPCEAIHITLRRTVRSMRAALQPYMVRLTIRDSVSLSSRFSHPQPVIITAGASKSILSPSISRFMPGPDVSRNCRWRR